ncbi:hypothetical protein [Streptomyces sp. NPDC002640]
MAGLMWDHYLSRALRQRLKSSPRRRG